MNALRNAVLASALLNVPVLAPAPGAGQVVQAAARVRAEDVDSSAKDTVPKVVGGVGWEFSVASNSRGASRFLLLSNLAGAAAGGAANGLGIDWLRDYFINNTALGVAFPSDGKLTGVLQIGLGEVTILKKTPLWPVLSLEQLDSADARVPAELRADSTASWTYPSFAVGFPIRIGAKETPPAIGTIGLGLPYFFPGSPFPAVGAVFSDNHKKYRRAGRVRVSFGVQILFRRASEP